MLDSAPERNLLLASLISHHGDLVARQSRGDEDDMQDLLLKLLKSSPDFLLPELAGYEIGQIDAKIVDVKGKLARSWETSKHHKELLARLGKLYQERDQLTAGPWIRTVLYRKAIDHGRTAPRGRALLCSNSTPIIIESRTRRATSWLPAHVGLVRGRQWQRPV
jgi:hypothetical protein